MAKVAYNTDNNKKAMLRALADAMGIVSTACKVVGISRQTHYQWLELDKKYAEAVEDISEAAIDFAESALHLKIAKGDVASIIFYLKTKGKSRGYIERQEIEHKGVILNFDKEDSKL